MQAATLASSASGRAIPVAAPLFFAGWQMTAGLRADRAETPDRARNLTRTTVWTTLFLFTQENPYDHRQTINRPSGRAAPGARRAGHVQPRVPRTHRGAQPLRRRVAHRGAGDPRQPLAYFFRTADKRAEP